MEDKDKIIYENRTIDLPMIPLRGLSVFPNMVLHFDIGREKSINALEKAMVNNQYIFLTSQIDENTDLPTPEDFYHLEPWAGSSRCSACREIPFACS